MNAHHEKPQHARSAGALSAALLACLVPAIASAQESAPPTPPAEAAPVVAPAAPPATTLAAATTTVAQATAEQPAVATQAPPAPPAVDDASSKPLSAAVWGRIGNVFQGADPQDLDDVSQDAEVDLLLSGQIHKYVGWQADFVGTFSSIDRSGTASILDLVGKLELDKTFNIWLGRMLVPSDRANFAGPWFMAPWNYPGFYPGMSAPAGPRQGPFGRNDGATVWGEFGGGTFKYYVGAFDLTNKGEAPLYIGRVNLSLLNPEPGYYHSSTYYGMDILAIGVGAQYKKNGSIAVPPPMAPPGTVVPPPSDYTGVNVDVLFEKKLGNAGAFDLEGAFYIFDGDNELLKNHFFALASYLVPATLGFGQIQPLVRFQGASPKAGGDMFRAIDAQVGYVISQYAARLALGYQNAKAGAITSNSVFVGLQLQK
jgi:hypothetical protein